MELSEYAARDATALKELLDAGEVTPDELRESALRAIEEVQPALNAVVQGPFDEPPPHDPSGPFGGVPFAVKDLFCAPAGYPQEFGSRLLEGFVPEVTTTLMERFQAAGLVMLAKTATPEFGFNANTAPVVNGPTRNPWDTDRIPGGSSGGSASLVGARALPVAHANDGGGSIRIPASCCGLVGLKPTRGRTPVGPELGEVLGGLAIEFAVSRTVRDSAALLDAVCGPASGDKYYVARPERPYASEVGADPGRLRIALQTDAPGGVPVDPEVAAAVEAVARRLEELGHSVEPYAPEVDLEAFLETTLPFWVAGVAAMAFAMGMRLGREPGAENLEAVTWASVQQGLGVTALQVAQAEMFQNGLCRQWGGFLDEYDLHLCPTLAKPPLPVGSLDQNDPKHSPRSWLDELVSFIPFTPIYNTTGQPSMSLPLGTTADGVPIGVMVSAQSLRDDLLIRVAAQLEEAMPWADRTPAVCVGERAAA